MAETNQPSGATWKAGKFECCEDFKDCMCAYCCSPCYIYKTVLASGEEQSCAIISALCPIALCCVRGNIREKQGIEGSAFGDCASLYFCGLCTVIQMKKEFD